MSAVFEDCAKQNNGEDVYEVVKTAVIVRSEKEYRIEILKCYSNSNVSYTATCYTEEEIDGKKVWVDYPIPSLTKPINADNALAQAFDFLPKAQRATAS